MNGRYQDNSIPGHLFDHHGVLIRGCNFIPPMRKEVSVARNRGRVVICHNAGKPAGQIQADPAGTVVMVIRDRKGKPVIEVRSGITGTKNQQVATPVNISPDSSA